MAYTVGSASVDIVPDFRRAQIEITRFFQQQPDKFTVPVKAQVDEEQARAAGARMGKAVEEGTAKSRAAGDRAAIQAARAREMAVTRAHGEALRIQAQMDRGAARETMRTTQALVAARARAENEAARDAARLREQAFKDEERLFKEQIKAQITAIKAAQRDASREEKIRLQVEIDQRQAILDARTTGGLIARSIHAEVRQNAGLIALAVGGALIAGAPVAAAAATTLFAGIGAAAAFQNDQLRQSWKGLWQDIKSQAVSDGAVLVPAFDRMAGSIGQSFRRIRPEIRDTFTSLVPQVDTFTASLLRAGENALPGLTRAVQAGMPVTRGFGDLLKSTGTGVSSFFDRITDHAPAAGAAFRELGDTMETVLPLLGEVLGEGAELAATALPALNTALHGTLTVVNALGGALPILGAGFLGFRLAQGAGRFIAGWATSLGMASIQGGRFADAQGRAAGALHNVSRAAPAVGAALAFLGAGMAESAGKVQDWASALEQGGAAAAAARREMQEQAAVAGQLGSGFNGLAADILGYGNTWSILEGEVGSAEQAHKDFIASLTPLESAQRDLDIATRNLAKGLDDESTSAAEVGRLQNDVAEASARAAREQDRLAMATRGVTEAMAEQADAARARVDADFGYQKALIDVQKALIDVTEAQTALDDARAEGDPADIAAAELELREAVLGVNEAYSDQVKLAGDIVRSNLPASMDDTQRAILGAKAELDELNRLIASGVQLSPSMEAYRRSLEGIVSGADGAALAQAQLVAALGEVGIAAEAIPGTKVIQIDAPTDAVKQRLIDLGFTVTEMLPDGEIRVEAKTEQAKANLDNLSTDLADLHGTTAQPGVTLVDKGFIGPVQRNQAEINKLGGTTALPGATLVDKGFIGPVQNDQNQMGILGRMHALPSVSVNDQASGPLGSIQRALNGIVDKSVTVSVTNRAIYQSVGTPGGAFQRMPVAAAGGAVEDLRPKRGFDSGGAIVGRGGARDDLVPFAGPDPTVQYRAANGEHILDGLDVLLMGGQGGVYAFREALNSGRFGAPGPDTAIRAMVGSRQPPQAASAAGGLRDVTILTQDNPRAIVRAIRADQHEQAALAPVW